VKGEGLRVAEEHCIELNGVDLSHAVLVQAEVERAFDDLFFKLLVILLRVAEGLFVVFERRDELLDIAKAIGRVPLLLVQGVSLIVPLITQQD